MKMKLFGHNHTSKNLKLLAFFAFLFMSLSFPVSSQEVKIATFRALAFFPAWFAKDAGFFEREGLNVELLFFSSGSEMTSAMLSKSAAFSTTSSDRPMLLKEKGQNTFNLISLTTRSPFSVLVPLTSTLPYGNVGALKGKKIGITQRGSSSDTSIRAILRPSGVDPDKDATLLALGSAEAGVAALGSGQIDALIVSEPGTSIAVNQEKTGKLFLDLRKGEGPPAASRATFYTLQATEEYVRANPEVVRKAMRAICKGTKAAKADPQAALKVAQKYFPKLDAAILGVALQSESVTFGTEITDDMIKAVSDAALSVKVIQKGFSTDDVVIGKDFRSLWGCN